MHGECSELASRSSSPKYVALMKGVTSPDLTVAAVTPYRPQICSVLYGVGDEDFSGIGISDFLRLSL